MSTFNNGRAFDWSQHDSNSPNFRVNGGAQRWESAKRQLRAGRAVDSGGSSGLAFLQSSLELINPRLIEPLQDVTHPRDMPMEFGGGFPEQLVAWASSYASSGGSYLGLQGTSNSDIPIAQADVQKGSWPVINWTQGFTVTYIDLKRWQVMERYGNQAPYTLQGLYESAVRTTWYKALDQITYLGWLGEPGLINNTSVPAFVVPSGGTSTTWASKSPVQILNDFNFAINLIIENSGYAANVSCPDTCLLPYNQFALLTQPMTIGGVGFESAIDYIRKHCVAASVFGNAERFKIMSLPNPWITGQGIGNTTTAGGPYIGTNGNGLDRAVFYRKDKDFIKLHVPTAMEPAMTIPTEKGPGYSTFFVGAIGVPQFFRTQSVCYSDGI